jgi:hypothetical protein
MAPEWYRFFVALTEQGNTDERRLDALEDWTMPDVIEGRDTGEPVYNPIETEAQISVADTDDQRGKLAELEGRLEGLETRVLAAEASLSTSEIASLQGAARYVWRDILGPVTGINPLGQASDPDIDPTDGTLLFDSSTEEVMALVIQVNHDWAGGVIDEGLQGRLHVHWSKTTDAAGDVEWEMRHRIFSDGDIPPAWSSWAAADTRSGTVDATQKQLIDGFPDIDMSGQEISCILSIQVRRNPAATDDTYGADAKIWSADMHYLSDSFKAG